MWNAVQGYVSHSPNRIGLSYSVSQSLRLSVETPALLEHSSRSRRPEICPVPRLLAGAQCDENGAVYFHVVTGGSAKNPTIFKLGRTEDEHQLYKLPPEVVDKKSAFYAAYSVTPAGRLWVLVVEWVGDEPKVAAYGFDSNTAVTSEVHMETPAHLRPRHFAAFDNDVFFVEGDISETLGSQKTSRPYAAIVDGAGTVMKELHLNLQGLQIQKGKIPEGDALAGRDGNFYMLLPDQVMVISQSGQIVRRLPFPKSDHEAIATGVSLSGGLVAIQIMEQQKHTLGLTLEVLDANTGDEVGSYRPSQELGNNLICFSRTEGFTFLGIIPGAPDGNLVLLTAALR